MLFEITAEETVAHILQANASAIGEFEALKRILADGSFHHATHRAVGQLIEGLYIYVNDNDGFRGFTLKARIFARSQFYDEANVLVRTKGVSVGSYGAG